MATEYYLGYGATPEVSPAFSSEWTVTTDAVRYYLSPTKRLSTMTTKNYTDSDDTDKSILFYQYVGPPMHTGQTVGTNSLASAIRCSETDAGNNMFLAMRVRLVKRDGTDYGTEKTICSLTLDGTEMAVSTLTSRAWALGASTDQTTAEGDRLVIEIGASGNPDSGKSHSCSISTGDDSSTNISYVSDAVTTANNPIFRFTTPTFTHYGQYLYLPAYTKSASAITAADSGLWTSTSKLFNTVDLEPIKGSSTLADHTITDSDSTLQSYVMMKYVSPPLHAMTISASNSIIYGWAIRGSETNASNNLDACLIVQVVDVNGSAYGTPKYLVATLDAADSGEVATTLQVPTGIITNYSASNVTIADNDRLVIEIGLRGDPTGSATHDGTLRFGNSASSDLTAAAETNDYNPWVQIVRGGGVSAAFPFKWDYSAGTTNYVSKSFTAAGANSRVLKPRITKTITAAGTVAKTRKVSLIKSLTAAASNTFSKITTRYRTFASTAAGTVSITMGKLYNKLLNYTAAGTATLSKLATYYRTLVSTAAGSVSLSRLKTFVKSLSFTAPGSVSKSITAKVTKLLTAAGTASLTYGKLFTRLLSSTTTMSSSVSKLSTLYRTFMASAPGSVSLAKALTYIKILAYTAAGTLGLTRSTKVIRAAIAAASNIFAKFAEYPRTFSASAAGVVSLAYTQVLGILIQLTAAMSAARSHFPIYVRLLQSTAPIIQSVSKTAKITKTIVADMTSSLSAIRWYDILLSMTAAMAASLSAVPFYGVSVLVEAIAAGAVSLTRKITLNKSFSAPGTLSMVKKISLNAFQATASGAASAAAIVLNLVNVSVAAAMNVALSTSMIISMGGYIATNWVRNITSKIVRIITNYDDEA